MPRKLRIAASVIFGVLTLALCVLWVRSYWMCDLVGDHTGYVNVVKSNNGYLTYLRQWDLSFQLQHLRQKRWWAYSGETNGNVPDKWYVNAGDNRFVAIHYCIPTVLAAGLAAILFHANPRSSLATLLTATIASGHRTWPGCVWLVRSCTRLLHFH